MFGYPECCVNYFIENVVYNNIKAGAEWWEKASEALKKGIYNDLFNYTFHVPCKLDCQETLRMAKEIKRVLELNDYEAAKYLREFNMEVLGK
ncbi:MAG: DUF483 domain-containing protein [Nanoarchaeota archaeon]|nr:DUF483 domain-containing protein [Nanoarchaeota archaeon]